MDSRATYGRLRENLLFELDSFTRSLRDFEAEAYPSEVALDMIGELDSEVGILKESVDRLDARVDSESEGALLELRTLRLQLYMRLNNYPGWLAGARTRRVPWSVIPGIERLANALYPERRLLTSCNQDKTYSIRHSSREPQGLARFYILSIPSWQRLNVLLHVVVAHELFHPIMRELLDTIRAEALTSIRKEWLEFGKPTLKRTLADFVRGERTSLLPSELSEAVDDSRKIWESAVSEIACDLGSVAVFGPAALFALGVTASFYDLDALPQDPALHPPWRTRFRAIMSQAVDSEEGRKNLARFESALDADADTKSLADLVRAEIVHYRKAATADTDIKALEGNDRFRIAYRQLEPVLPRVWSFISERCSRLPFRWTDSIDQVPDLLKVLRLPAPPGEGPRDGDTTAAACPSAIANAAWLFNLDGRRLGGDGVTLDRRTTSKLVLKGLEDAWLIEKYKELSAGATQ